MTDDETKELFAVKVVNKATLDKSRSKKQKLMMEIKVHRSTTHQHICRFHHYFEDADNVYMLLELCTNQTLHDLVKRRGRLHELEVKYYAA